MPDAATHASASTKEIIESVLATKSAFLLPWVVIPEDSGIQNKLKSHRLESNYRESWQPKTWEDANICSDSTLWELIGYLLSIFYSRRRNFT